MSFFERFVRFLDDLTTPQRMYVESLLHDAVMGGGRIHSRRDFPQEAFSQASEEEWMEIEREIEVAFEEFMDRPMPPFLITVEGDARNVIALPRISGAVVIVRGDSIDAIPGDVITTSSKDILPLLKALHDFSPEISAGMVFPLQHLKTQFPLRGQVRNLYVQRNTPGALRKLVKSRAPRGNIAITRREARGLRAKQGLRGRKRSRRGSR